MSIKKVLIALAALLVVGGLASYFTQDDNAEMVAVDRLRASMRDPASATFQNVNVYRFQGPDEDRMAFVCGEVNAKNALGGYVGNRPFVVAIIGTEKPENVSIAKVAGQDWQPCELCRKFDDYMREDAGRVDAFCSLGKKHADDGTALKLSELPR